MLQLDVRTDLDGSETVRFSPLQCAECGRWIEGVTPPLAAPETDPVPVRILPREPWRLEPCGHVVDGVTIIRWSA